jgi:ABC-type branched-subunit amino acid transport system substrate-binding protein
MLLRIGSARCRYRRLDSKVVWPGGSSEVPLPVNVLRIGALLPQTGSWLAGRTILGAALLAVDDINNDPTLLGGYVVELKWLDSGCAAPQGITAMSGMLSDKNVAAVIGPGTRRHWRACVTVRAFA